MSEIKKLHAYHNALADMLHLLAADIDGIACDFPQAGDRNPTIDEAGDRVDALRALVSEAQSLTSAIGREVSDGRH
jgi:hypothetical protein